MPAVQLEKVSLRFGTTTVVSDVDLHVHDGEFITLLGPSGCGKTSTLRIIAGLQHNTGGRVSVGDRIVSDAEAKVFLPPELRRLGMVFQSYAIWPHMTVFENVAYPLKVRRRRPADLRERVNSALRMVDMEAYAGRPAPALSGGQQQRVAIARALVGEPSVLLLDEPLSNLDAKLRTQMAEEFRSLQHRLGITTIYVTHDQEEAMALSDRIVLMNNGHILQSGSPQELYRRPVNRSVAAFFGTPNIFEATVTGCRPCKEGFSVGFESPLGAGHANSAATFAPGERALVVVRPEDMTLAARDRPRAENALSVAADVLDSVFRGGRATILAAAATSQFRIDVPSLLAPAVGSAVRVEAPLSALWALKADETLRANAATQAPY